MGAAKAISPKNDKRVQASSFVVQLRPIKANRLAGSLRLTSTAKRSTQDSSGYVYPRQLNWRDQAESLFEHPLS